MMDALEWTARLSAVLAIIQGIEFLFLFPQYSDKGVWRWSDLKEELGALNLFLGLFLKPKAFFVLNGFRILTGIGLLFYQVHWGLVSLLLFFHLLTLIRWRGTFNGGSDYMNLLVLMALTLALYFDESFFVVMGALGYIALQLILSYFKAGFLKLKDRPWRKGLALKEFVSSPIYQSTGTTKFLLQHRRLLLFLSWSVIVFEVAFPLSLLGPNFAVLFICMAVFFHLGNVYLFGLNRFFFSWITAYPSLYFCSLYLSHRGPAFTWAGLF